MYELYIIIIFIIIILFIFLVISNDMNKSLVVIDEKPYYKPFNNDSNLKMNLNKHPIDNPNDRYILNINEEELRRSNVGYENELMFKNNLKDGDYINYFQEEISEVPTDNQIGFHIEPRDRPYKLPYSNIHIKCI